MKSIFSSVYFTTQMKSTEKLQNFRRIPLAASERFFRERELPTPLSYQCNAIPT